MIGAAFLICFLAFLLLFYFAIRFRERPGHRAKGRLPHWLEVGLAGFTLSAFLVWWVIGFAQYREMRERAGRRRASTSSPSSGCGVRVSRRRRRRTTSRVPVGRPVELSMTSRDVIHSFYVPAFRVKQDVCPAACTTMWFEATSPAAYDIRCAEYCGAGHSRMRGHVDRDARRARLRRVARRPCTATDLAATRPSKLAAERGCLRCHTVDGTPHLGPTWNGLYGSRGAAHRRHDGRSPTRRTSPSR